MKSGLLYFFYATAPLLLISSVSLSLNSKVIHYYHNVQINWTDQVIVAQITSQPIITENGVPLDTNTLEPLSINNARSRLIQESKDMATESLITALHTIPVDPFHTLGEFIQDNDYTQRKLGLYQHEIKYSFKPDGVVSTMCIATLPMGKLLKLLPEALPSRDIPVLPVKLPATEYTGLIVDTRGLKHVPMLFPSLYAEDNTEIFGKDFINPHDAFVYGTVSYCYTDDSAIKHKKAGRFPYYCAALRMFNGCPVIANSDLKKILSSSVTRNNLKKGNIVIIIDRE